MSKEAVSLQKGKRDGSSPFIAYVVSSGAVSFALLGVSMITGVLTARLLGPTGKGQMTLAMMVLGMSGMVGELGLGFATVYYTRKYSLGELASATLFLTAIIPLFIAPLAAGIVYLFRDSVFSNVPSLLLVLAITFLPVSLLRTRQENLLRAGYYIHLLNISTFLPPLIYCTFLILMVPGWLPSTVLAVFEAHLASVLLGAGISGLFLRRVLKGQWCKPSTQIAREVLGYGLKAFVGNLFKFLQYRFDMFLVSYFLSPREVGFYSVAVMFCEILWRFPDAVGGVLLPKVAGLQDTQVGIRFTARSARVTAAFCGLVSVVMFALAGVLVNLLYGTPFAPSVSAIRYLLPGVLFLSVWKILHQGLVSTGHAKTYSLSVAASSAVMIALDLVLIPRWGVNGASIASSGAYAVAALYVILATRKIYEVSISEMLVLQRSDLRELWIRDTRGVKKWTMR